MYRHFAILLLLASFTCQKEKPSEPSPKELSEPQPEPEPTGTPTIDYSCVANDDCLVLPSACARWTTVNRASEGIARERARHAAGIKKCNVESFESKPLAHCEEGRCVPVKNPSPTIDHDCTTSSDCAVIPAGCDWATVHRSSVKLFRETFDNSAKARNCRPAPARKPYALCDDGLCVL